MRDLLSGVIQEGCCPSFRCPNLSRVVGNVKGMLACNFVHANGDGYYGFFGENDLGEFYAQKCFVKCNIVGSVFCSPGEHEDPIEFNMKLLEKGSRVTN